MATDDHTCAQVVYSPHTYGPSVYAQPYFDAADFPRNLASIWSLQYGDLARTAPVVVGEWGGHLVDKELTWATTFAKYMGDHGIGSFFWCLNPSSADTGGLITGWQLPLRASPSPSRPRV